MTAATMQQTPAVPPRPSRASEKDGASVSSQSMPKVPPRPLGRRIDRSASPNANRFAQSPFNENIKSPKNLRFSPNILGKESDGPIERPSSVSMPSVGEEGMEYGNVANDLGLEKTRSISPEQTRTVGEELKLHAPKPSLPANTAKRQVQQVTRTDSDKAASFGLSRRSMEERPRSGQGNRRRPSSSYSANSDQPTDDEQGIPEIGQRVPMNPHLGDVQAPSPGPGAEGRHHHRKHSARNLPPGSYGLHGHGQLPLDKLDKEYYQRHPEVMEREKHHPLHDRQNDFAMSRDDLNKLVRDTPNRHLGSRMSGEYRSTPTDEVAFQASDRYASNMATPHDSPAIKADDSSGKPNPNARVTSPEGEETIHVDDPRHPEYRSYGDEEPGADSADHEYNVPILAADEVQKDTHRYAQLPAIHPPPERHGSAFEEDETVNRPPSRPNSLYRTISHQEHTSTPLEDVQEYEPLFDEEKEKKIAEAAAAEEHTARHHFPSKDIWEDAPASVHFSAEVNTPEPDEFVQHVRTKSYSEENRSMTPAQAFAQHQEELAEREARGPAEDFVPRAGAKPTWINSQPHLQQERPSSSHRFPSRDIWEDVPESQLHSATITPEPSEMTNKPMVPSRPAKKASDSSEKPAIPGRPKPKQTPSDEAVKTRPPVSDKPKPQVPNRPTKSLSGDSAQSDTAKPKPPVPSRPVGGKIAALQAGFMSDLNKRLQLGPQGQKKEEPQEEPAEEEKAPLADARKSRARGPQRRAPAKATPNTNEPAASVTGPVLSFSFPQTSWTIDPEGGDIAVDKLALEETEMKGIPSDEPMLTTVEGEAIAADKAGEAVHLPASQEPAVSSDKPVLSEEPAPLDEEDHQLEQEEARGQETQGEEADKSLEKSTPQVLEKTLVSNTAGESILETTIEKTEGGDVVEPVQVKDEVQS